MTPSRKLLTIFILVAALCLGAGFVAGKFVRSPAQVAADADPPPTNLLTAPVTRGTVTRQIVVRGSVTRGATVAIGATAPAGTEAIVTRQPLRVGQRVRPGAVVAEISYRPVIVLPGRIPMIRDLRVGSTGPDVTGLQHALKDLGWTIYDTDGVFGASTAAALSNLYRSVGYEVPIDQVSSEPTSPESTTGDPTVADSDSTSAVSGQERAGTDSAAAAGTLRAPSTQAAPEPREVVVARKSELVIIADLPGTVTAVTARVGTTPSESVLSVSTEAPTVHAVVAPSQRSLIHEGDIVTLSSTSPLFQSRGRVSRIGATAQDEQTKAFSVPIVIHPAKPLPDGTLDKGIEVRINVKKAAATGMIVPVAAIYTNNDGSTAVLKVVDGHTSPVRVRVEETGSGRARVMPERAGDLSSGDLVRVGLATVGQG